MKMRTLLMSTARGECRLASNRYFTSCTSGTRSAPQFSSRIGNAYLPSHLKAEGVRRKTAASASFRRARYVYVRGATAYDDRDAPSFKPVDLAQANFNTVESKMFRDTMLASFVQAVLKSVCALLKCTLVKSSSVFFSRTGCLTRYKTSSLFLAQCTTAATFATAFAELSGNLVFMCAFWSWLTAQTMKYFTAFYREGKWDWRVMFDSGGMPSSHTSLVVGLTTAIGYQYGLSSTMFPLSLAFSLIVMYDAAGVRRHAGKQAEVLNKILEGMFHGESISERKLKEVLGHSPLQVMAGAVLGVFVAVVYAYQYGSGYAALSAVRC